MKIVKYSFLIVLAIFSIFPFYWMFTTAFSQHTFISNPQLFPIPFYLGAIKDVIFHHPFWRWIFNTALITSIATIGNVFFASLAAFAFACIKFKGRDFIFYALLSTMILPGFLMIIPRFFIMAKLGWLNTYQGVFIVFWFVMFSTFLLRQYYLSISHGVLNAARIDGCNLWQMYIKIILPMSKPVLLTLFIIRFVQVWNSFLWPVIVLRSTNMKTLTVGMSEFYGIYMAEYNKIMAGGLISLIPIFIIFALFAKQIEKGLQFQLKT